MLQNKVFTCDKILAHSDMVDKSLRCDAASKRDKSLFSNSTTLDSKVTKVETEHTLILFSKHTEKDSINELVYHYSNPED